MAAQLSSTNGPSPRPGVARWTRCATSSLPVPVSPVTSTVVSGEAATLVASASTWRMAAE